MWNVSLCGPPPFLRASGLTRRSVTLTSRRSPAPIVTFAGSTLNLSAFCGRMRSATAVFSSFVMVMVCEYAWFWRTS